VAKAKELRRLELGRDKTDLSLENRVQRRMELSCMDWTREGLTDWSAMTSLRGPFVYSLQAENELERETPGG
jgi:hypothetical protein